MPATHEYVTIVLRKSDLGVQKRFVKGIREGELA